MLSDPPEPAKVLRDPSDDYLVALARAGEAEAIVTGDQGPPRARRAHAPGDQPAAGLRGAPSVRNDAPGKRRAGRSASRVQATCKGEARFTRVWRWDTPHGVHLRLPTWFRTACGAANAGVSARDQSRRDRTRSGTQPSRPLFARHHSHPLGMSSWSTSSSSPALVGNSVVSYTSVTTALEP